MTAAFTLPSPDVLLRKGHAHPHAPTVFALISALLALTYAGYLIARNLRHNEPGLTAPMTHALAFIVSGAGLFSASRLTGPAEWIALGRTVAGSLPLFLYTNRHRFVRDPADRIITNRSEIVLKFAGFRWTRDKANRHFFFSGDTGSGKTSSGMNGLLDSLLRHNPRLGGVVMANKGDEWFVLERLARRHGREQDLIRLRPRIVGDAPNRSPTHWLNVTGDARLPFTTRARLLVDTAGETGTSQNYLEYLGTPEIAEVFSSNEPDTCSIADVDRGKTFCIDVPQDYTTERQYIFTLMKLLLYQHALRRYSLPPYERYALNQLVFIGEEFQNAITASLDGTSDFNVIDRLRDCWLMMVVSAQAFESLIPPQTREQAEVPALNLKNLVMYRAASETDAKRCAEALGRHYVERSTRTVKADNTSHSYQRVEEYRMKPHEFRAPPDHTAVVRHCTNGYRKVRLRPL